MAKIRETVQSLQSKKASKTRDDALRSELHKIYQSIKPFAIGRIHMDPHHLHPPPHVTANKDYYPDQKDKIKKEWLIKGPAFKIGEFLTTIFNV